MQYKTYVCMCASMGTVCFKNFFFFFKFCLDDFKYKMLSAFSFFFFILNFFTEMEAYLMH